MSLLRACKSDNGRCNRCLSKTSRTRNALAHLSPLDYTHTVPISTNQYHIGYVNPFLARPQREAVKLWTSPLTTTSNSLLPPAQGVEATVQLATAPVGPGVTKHHTFCFKCLQSIAGSWIDF